MATIGQSCLHRRQEARAQPEMVGRRLSYADWVKLLRQEQKTLTKTLTVLPPTVIGVVLAAVPAVDDTLCCLLLVACPVRCCFPTFP